MQLIRALRLSQRPRLALVGAGGKTTALFRLARQLQVTSSSPVFLTATTHLATHQLQLADRHFVIETPKDLPTADDDLSSNPLLLFTGPPTKDKRTRGLDDHILGDLRALADKCQAALLVEADGSRQRPLKAPADHEPVIPPWAEVVVVVAGLSALGKPLTSEWVHRTERFSALSGLSPGELITSVALERALTSPSGGLKGIPPGARRIALLNQADDPEQQARAQRLAERLLGSYHAVLVAALAPPAESVPSEKDVYAAIEPTAGILLAAGESSRLGSPKQLLDWHGKPLVRHVARTALAAGLSPVIVVTGAVSDQVQAALEGLEITIAYNPHWQSGQSTSVIAGMNTLPRETGAAVFLLADQPQIPQDLVRSLVGLHRQSLAPIIVPLVDGQRGNPVLFDRQTFPDLKSLTGDTGGRAVFARHQVTWLPWIDPAILTDVDTPEDYQHLLRQ